MSITYRFEADASTGELIAVMPCRCGVSHSGDYAIYDWGHHNCFHTDYPLTWLSDAGEDHMQLMCPQCGQVFDVESPKQDSEALHGPPSESGT